MPSPNHFARSARSAVFGRLLFAVVLLPMFLTATPSRVAWASDPGNSRTWTDDSGKFSVAAEFVRVDQRQVVLRKSSGVEIRVPIERLAAVDRKFLRDVKKDPKKDREKIQAVVRKFLEGLREEDRMSSRQCLTAAAVEAEKKAGKLKKLSVPDAGRQSIRVGKTQISKDGRSIVMSSVRVKRKFQPAFVHLKKDNEEWKIHALSNNSQGSQKIDFEDASSSESNAKSSMVGKPMPLEGLTTTGQPLNMSAYRGKVVLVDFWATWCGPCVREIPNIKENYEKYHSKGFEVVAISLDRNMDDLQKFLAKEQPPWVVVADRHPNNPVSMSKRYGVRAIPSFYLLGPDGNVVAENCRGARLGKELDKLLGD